MAEDEIKSALSDAKRSMEYWHDIYQEGASDLKFLSDDKFAQWDEKDYNARMDTGRPALTFDQLSQFVHQVANDIRQNTPTFTVIPDDEESSEDQAEAFRAIIRGIEYKSNADDVYDTAALNSIKSSIGFIRIDHDYVSNEGFEQHLIIKRVVNPFSCFIDPESIECDGRDAKFGFVIDKYRLPDFKKRWPGKATVSFEGDKGKPCEKDEEEIYVAEFFRIVDEEKTIALTEMGVVEFQPGMPDNIQKRQISTSRVKRCMYSGSETLEETWFPGTYVPLVPVYGEEHWIEGKRTLFSLIRKAKPAQKMYNLWRSLETEVLMKQPQAPVMAPEGAIEDYATDWTNPQKSFVLRYKQMDAAGRPLNPPTRLEPPTLPAGMINAAREAVDDIKSSMGLYNASIGQRSNETSGVAIKQRQQEGDVATFHFYDNLVRSITHVYRILINAISEVYDTPRVLRAVGKEEEPYRLGVNGATIDDQKETVDLKRGKFTVRVVPGASFTTRRQEAAAFYSDIASKQPQLMAVMGDLLFKYSDMEGAEAMSERMKKTIDPKLLQEDEEQNPMVMQLQERVQQAEQVIQALDGQLKQVDQMAKMDKAEGDLKAQYDQLKAEEQLAQFKVQLAEERLKNAELQMKLSIREEISRAEAVINPPTQLPPEQYAT